MDMLATISLASPIVGLRAKASTTLLGGCPYSVSGTSVILNPACYTNNDGRRRGSRSGVVAVAGGKGPSSYSSPEARPPLAQLCHTLELCFFEVCVRNLGRPAGLALHGFVSATVEAFSNGYTREQVSLQLTFGSAGMHEFEVGTAGCRLTATEERYRSKWLETVYTTLQMLKVKDNDALRSVTTDDMQLYSTIHHVLEGKNSGDEQSSINFDRGLATRGASGGVVTGKVVIAPQWVPVSQLVLLTMKVVSESK